MDTHTSHQMEHLQTRGYLLIKQFIGEQDIADLTADFHAAQVGQNSNYHVRRLSLPIADRIARLCIPLANSLAQTTGLRANAINDAIYFATFTDKRTLTSPSKGEQRFPWHQDHENYWQWQDVKNYLNFYIPIVKPYEEKSNLGLLPFDRLQQVNPTLADQMTGLGATRILKKGNRWVVRDDSRDRNLGFLGIDPAEIQDIPHLASGDLLLMRGDLVHCTQDASTRRIAISLRMINGDAEVSRSKMARGGVVKSLMMHNSRSVFGPTFAYFDWLKTDRVPARLLNEHMTTLRILEQQGYRAPSQMGRQRFLRKLAWEKIRALYR